MVDIKSKVRRCYDLQETILKLEDEIPQIKSIGRQNAALKDITYKKRKLLSTIKDIQKSVNGKICSVVLEVNGKTFKKLYIGSKETIRLYIDLQNKINGGRPMLNIKSIGELDTNDI